MGATEEVQRKVDLFDAVGIELYHASVVARRAGEEKRADHILNKLVPFIYRERDALLQKWGDEGVER